MVAHSSFARIEEEPMKGARGVVLTVCVLILQCMGPAPVAHATLHASDTFLKRLGTTSKCSWSRADIGWGDWTTGEEYDADTKDILFEATIWRARWVSSTSCIDDDPPSATGDLGIESYEMKQYDWEEGADKFCYDDPAAGGPYAGRNTSTAYGWADLVQWPVPCGGFTPDPDGSGGGDWNINTSATAWLINYGGVTYTALVPIGGTLSDTLAVAAHKYYASDYTSVCQILDCNLDGVGVSVVPVIDRLTRDPAS